MGGLSAEDKTVTSYSGSTNLGTCQFQHIHRNGNTSNTECCSGRVKKQTPSRQSNPGTWFFSLTSIFNLEYIHSSRKTWEPHTPENPYPASVRFVPSTVKPSTSVFLSLLELCENEGAGGLGDYQGHAT